MKIFLGSDHAAYDEKELIKSYLSETCEVEDLGPFSAERCDYPDFASAVSKRVQAGEGRGFLLCGSGIGVSMVANRFSNVRAALVRTPKEAELSRQHNDSNVLCVGARINSVEEIKEMAKAWLNTEFENGRHSGRIEKFNQLGEKA